LEEGAAALIAPVLRKDINIFSKVGCMSWKSGSTHHTVIFVYVFPDPMMAERNAIGKVPFWECREKKQTARTCRRS